MRFRWLHLWAVRTAVLAALLAAVQTPLLRAHLAAVERGRRQLLNEREVGDEAAVAAGTEAAVKDYFFSFRDYQDLMLFHPKFGYYSSGFVSFVADWTTYPVVLRPYFGQMIAEQIFRMWDGMRRAGTLAAEEPFTIADEHGFAPQQKCCRERMRRCTRNRLHRRSNASLKLEARH